MCPVAVGMGLRHNRFQDGGKPRSPPPELLRSTCSPTAERTSFHPCSLEWAASASSTDRAQLVRAIVGFVPSSWKNSQRLRCWPTLCQLPPQNPPRDGTLTPDGPGGRSRGHQTQWVAAWEAGHAHVRGRPPRPPGPVPQRSSSSAIA